MPDFFHSMRYHLAHGQPERVIWYWRHLADYLWMHSRYLEFIECARYAMTAVEQLAATDVDGQRRTRAMIAAQLAFGHIEIGELDQVERYIDEAETLFRQLGDLAEAARVVRYRANLQVLLAHWEAAEAYCRESLLLIEAAEHADPSVSPPRYPLHNLLGAIALKRGDDQGARRAFLASLKAARRLDVDRIYWSLAPMLNLARLHENAGRSARALHYYRRCLALTEDGENRGLRAAALLRMATLLAEDMDEFPSQTELAERFAREAFDLYADMGKWEDQAQAARLLERLARGSSSI